MKYWRRVAIVFIGLVESLLYSGCLFGWPSLLYVLQQEGVYSHLCHDAAENDKTTFSIPPYSSTVGFSPTPMLETTATFWTTNKRDELVDAAKSTQDEQNFTEDEFFQFGKRRDTLGANNSEEEIETRILTRHAKFCNAQSVQMTLIYTVAAVSYGLTSILIGFSLDILGLWFTRFGGCILTTGGFFILAFTDKDNSWLLWPALNLIALGTSQLRLSSFQFANCWPLYRTTILIFYSSAYSVSTALFLLIQIAYVGNIPYKTIGITLAVISLLTFPCTLIMPKMRIEDQVEIESNALGNGNNKKKATSSTSIADDVTRLDRRHDSNDSIPRILKEKVEGNRLVNPFDEEEDVGNKKKVVPKADEVPISTSLWTLSAAFHLLWHFINFFLILFYSATFMLWIQMMTDDPKTIEHYNKIIGVCALIAPIFIPIAGLVTDWQIRKASKLESREEKLAETMQAPAITKALASFFVLGTMICKVFFTPLAVYFSMVLIAIARPFIVGSCASYIRIRFHPSHFNRLNGIFTTIVSILCLLQFPMVVWMKRSTADFVMAQVVLIGILVLGFISPVHIMINPLARKFARAQLKFRTDI